MSRVGNPCYRKTPSMQVVNGPTRGTRIELSHSSFLKKRVHLAHQRHRFGVACFAMLADASDEQAGQAQRPELWVDDHAADGADVMVGEGQLCVARAAQAQCPTSATGA